MSSWNRRNACVKSVKRMVMDGNGPLDRKQFGFVLVALHNGLAAMTLSRKPVFFFFLFQFLVAFEHN